MEDKDQETIKTMIKSILKPFYEDMRRSNHIMIGDYTMALHSGDPMKMSLYDFEPVETSMVKEHIRSGDIVVDVGANAGYYSLLFASLGARVYSYEPHPQNFALLKHNVERNNINNITLYNAAVSDVEGMTNLHISEGVGQHRIVPSRFCHGMIQVPVMKINLEHIDFAKIDVEGGEIRVLDGMTSIPDRMIIEFNYSNMMEHQSNPQRLFDILRNHKVQIITRKGLQELDYDFLANSEMSVNLFCK